MQKNRIMCCAECAYVQKTGDEMWCPFHDLRVASNLVCDNYLDIYASPLYTSLAEDDKKITVGVIIKDIIGYLISLGLIIICGVVTHGFLTT